MSDGQEDMAAAGISCQGQGGESLPPSVPLLLLIIVKARIEKKKEIQKPLNHKLGSAVGREVAEGGGWPGFPPQPLCVR